MKTSGYSVIIHSLTIIVIGSMWMFNTDWHPDIYIVTYMAYIEYSVSQL